MAGPRKTDEQVIQELRGEVQGLKKQLKDVPAETTILRRENQRLRRRQTIEGGAVDIIVNTAREVVEDWDFVLELPPPLVLKARSKKEPCVALAHVTDTQIGKVTASFDSAIAEQRLMHYAKEIVSCVHKHHKGDGVQELHVYFGGDMVEGDQIFPHQAHQIDHCVFDQACVIAPRILTQMLLYWSSYFARVRVFAVRGNHGRVGRKSDGNSPRTNWDSVCYEIMKLMTEKALIQAGRDEDVIEFHLAETWYIVDDLLGHRNLLIHGDQGIRGSLGFPWYGLTKKMAGWIDAVPDEWDNVFLGHFHQYVSADWNGRLWYCGGTIESDNEYARAELAATGRPKQRFQIWDRRHGPIVDLPIYLDTGRARVRRRRKATF